MKRTAKCLALLLAVMMLVTLVACSTSPDGSTPPVDGSTPPTDGSTAPDATPTPGEPTTGAVMEPFAPYEETVTISVARHLNLGGQLAPNETTSDNVFIDVIKDKLNVQVVVDWETSPDAYKQKLALGIASRDLPDVFGLERSEYLTFQSLVAGGVLADLTDAYNNCIGGIDAEYLKAFDGSQNTAATFDGRLMGIPALPGGYSYNVLWIRGDWLTKLGLPMPKTVDDIKTVALAFKENKLGGENTTGIVVDPKLVYGNSGSFLSFSTVANSQGAYPGSWIYDANGGAVYGSVQPEMKDALAVALDWYQSGVMDPQFMTYQNMDAVTPALRDGTCGMFFGAYWAPWTMADSRKADPEMEWVAALAPLDNNGNFNHIASTDAEGWLVVNKACENPEAVVKALNVVGELTRGVYNDDPKFADAITASKAIGSFGRTLNPFAGCGNLLSAMFDHEPQMGVSLKNYIETGTLEMFPGASDDDWLNAKKGYDWFMGDQDRNNTEGYSFYTSFKAIADMYLFEKNHDELVAYAYTSESMGDYWTALYSLEEEMITQIISGQKPLSYFDEFVSTWKNSGGDIITGEINEIISNLK